MDYRLGSAAAIVLRLRIDTDHSEGASLGKKIP